MKKKLSHFFLIGVCVSLSAVKINENKEKAKGPKNITVKYKSRPFYFRFPPKLKNIKSKKVIMAKIEYDHPTLGKCTYEMVKDPKESKFYGWCNSKKIARRKTVIFDIEEDFKSLELSETGVELGLNAHAKEIIEKMNEEHKRHKK